MGKDMLAKVFELNGLSTIESVLDTSNTNWDVEVIPATVVAADGRMFDDGNYRSIIRPDTQTALAFVGDRSRFNSHREQLSLLQPLLSSGELIPATASVWDNGALLAYQFRCPNLDIQVLDKDVVSPLLTLVFGYGFKVADSAFFSDFRWFCKNQMGKVAKLMSGAGKVRHFSGIKDKYSDIIHKRIGEVRGELQDHYKLMGKMPAVDLNPGQELWGYFGRSLGMTNDEVKEVYGKPIGDLRGESAKIPEIVMAYQQDDAGAPGTVWHAYNAVTRYQTHQDGRTPETRLRKALLGSGADVCHNAWQEAARLVA